MPVRRQHDVGPAMQKLEAVRQKVIAAHVLTIQENHAVFQEEFLGATLYNDGI